jgi:hypothetical protein
MGDFWPPGPKNKKYLDYEKLQFVQNCFSSYDMQAVDDYSIALGKILRWI